MKTFELNNKQTIPAVGFGVFMIPNDGPTYDATLAALKAGYREGVYSEYAKDVVRPSAEECAQNGRARSTKMRWAVKAE